MKEKITRGDVNDFMAVDAGEIMPLVGFGSLPRSFRFKVRMYPFGKSRCFAIIPIECLSECFDALGVGQCPKLIHEAIYQQLHLLQIDIHFAGEEDLPVLIEVFSRYRCEWQHFESDSLYVEREAGRME